MILTGFVRGSEWAVNTFSHRSERRNMHETQNTSNTCHRFIQARAILPLLCGLVLCMVNATAQTQLPHIFYSDLESGPNTGGDNNAGAYVTIYGRNFGASRGSSQVSVGGGAAVAYSIWSDTKIAFQLGATAASGNIVVTTGAGTSNGVPFTVRAGNLYFVSTSGSDAASGFSGSPWKTLIQARNAIKAGDIVYAMNGVSQTTDDGQGWSADMTLRQEWCTASGYPRAMVAYPGATATIGNPNESNQGMSGLRTTDSSAGGGACPGNWVFAGLLFRGTNPIALGGGSNWRFVANDISCPNSIGSGGGACMETSRASYIKFLGNNVHDAGASNASSLFQGVYFSSDSNHIEMGWNIVANVHGCRGVQFHSSPIGSGTGLNQYDLSVHDNVIHDTQCDGIIFATVDPSKGKVEAYNNVIYNAGEGPNNPEQTGNWACIFAPGTTNSGSAGGGVIEVYGNTMYNCGSFSNPPYGGSSGGVMNGGGNSSLTIRLRNNIIQTPSGIPYIDPSSGSSITGSNNLFFGSGSAPANLSASLNVDPKFVNAASADFHLASGSPAASAGTATSQLFDLDGIAFGSVYPIGAYASSGSGTGTSVTVNINPTAVSLQASQTQQFTATTSGASNPALTWSLSPAGTGTLSSSGLYTAPASISTTQTVSVKAALTSDTTKSATALVTLSPTVLPSIKLTPLSATVNAGGTQQFSATVAALTAGLSSTIGWSLSPSVGTISSGGLYAAPSSISGQQTVTIKATLLANTAIFATATLTVNPAASVSVSVNPSSASLIANQQQQFSATVTGTSATAVTWSVMSGAGSISSAGLYTAPSSIATQQSVIVKATLNSDSTKFDTAAITLNPGTTTSGQYSLSFIPLNSSYMQVMWTAPAGRPFNDTIALSSPGAPYWWQVWQQSTNGAQGGSLVVPKPAGPAMYEFRYLKAGGYTTAVISDSFAVNVAGFKLAATPAKPSKGAKVTVTWTAPSGRPADTDWIGLFKVGTGVGSALWWIDTNGTTSGTATFKAPSSGAYVLRYINDYVSVQSVPITVQ